MRTGRPCVHTRWPAGHAIYQHMPNAWACRPVSAADSICLAAAMLHTTATVRRHRQQESIMCTRTCHGCSFLVCQAVKDGNQLGTSSPEGRQKAASNSTSRVLGRTKARKPIGRGTSMKKNASLDAAPMQTLSAQTHIQQFAGSAVAAMQLPAAYHTVLCEHEAAEASDWTADDTLAAADRQAIRRAEQTRLARHAAARAQLPPPPTVITRLPAHFAPEVLDNAMLLLDKPLDWEADETARALRWALSGARIGYVGGLEPGATGLMLLLFNKATTLTSILQNLGSTYTATIRLGVSTDTFDAAGRVTMLAPWQQITDEEIQQVALQLLGKQVQVPPAFTAVKLRGKPVYDLTRVTSKDELVPRPVTIMELSLERLEPGSQDLNLKVTFARSGYMRSLAHEIGQRLGCGAHLTAWRREAVGGFLIDNAWTLDVLLPVARKFVGRVKRKK